MSKAKADKVEQAIVRTIRSKTGNGKGQGVPATDVLATVEKSLDVPSVSVRGAMWRLIDEHKIEFTEGRKVRAK